jgi:hypothetical protein
MGNLFVFYVLKANNFLYWCQEVRDCQDKGLRPSCQRAANSTMRMAFKYLAAMMDS